MSPDFSELQFDQFSVATFILRIIYPAVLLLTGARLFIVSVRALRSTPGARRNLVGWIVASAAGWVLITALFGVMGYFLWDMSRYEYQNVKYTTRPFGAVLGLLGAAIGYGWLCEKINGVLMDASRENTSNDRQAGAGIQS